MSAQYKPFSVNLDLFVRKSNKPFTVFEGDNTNIIRVTLTASGTPVDLTDCIVLVGFARGSTPVEQDSEGNGVTIEGTSHNVIVIDLYPESILPGENTAQIQILSGDTHELIATVPKFNFTCERPIINEDTVLTVPSWPLLNAALDKLANIQRGVQADCAVTDPNDPALVKNQPVIGTDTQAATQTLDAATEEIADTATLPTCTSGEHKSITWANIKDWLGAVFQTAFEELFAPLKHASRHGASGEDAITPSAINAAAKSAVHSVTLSAASWASGLYTISLTDITASRAVEILPSQSITAAQLLALQTANIQENSQSAGSIVIKAFGTVPAINIPIRVIVRGDLY